MGVCVCVCVCVYTCSLCLYPKVLLSVKGAWNPAKGFKDRVALLQAMKGGGRGRLLARASWALWGWRLPVIRAVNHWSLLRRRLSSGGAVKMNHRGNGYPHW